MKVKLDYSMYSKQTDLKSLYSWNKMWSLKNLAMLKCESSTSLTCNTMQVTASFFFVLFLLF